MVSCLYLTKTNTVNVPIITAWAHYNERSRGSREESAKMKV